MAKKTARHAALDDSPECQEVLRHVALAEATPGGWFEMPGRIAGKLYGKATQGYVDRVIELYKQQQGTKTMAKKKAARKTTKRSGPTRACEKCGERYHPKKANCPKCDAANPTRTKKTTRKVARPKAATNNQPTDLDAAIAFVQQCGGLANAKKALETIETIKNL